MKRSITHCFLYSAVLALSQCTALHAQEKSDAPASSLGRKQAVLVSVTASVEAIDLKNREVTLKGPLGNEVTFVVDKKVKRLDEVKVGDLVQAEYYIAVVAELRKPTAEEKKNPLVVLDAAGKAPPGAPPAAGGLRTFRVVTTIEGLDRPTQTVTVRGPRGNYLTARVADPSRLTQARIGDNVVITYTEALAISLEKVSKHTSE